MRTSIVLLALLLLIGCQPKPEPCFRFEAPLEIGQEVRIVNCSRKYSEISVFMAGFLQEDLDLPHYTVKFDKPGDFEFQAELTNERSTESFTLNIPVTIPEADDLIGKRRLYKAEKIGEFDFENRFNIFDYSAYEIKAYDETLKIQNDSIFLSHNQNADKYLSNTSYPWSLENGDFSTQNRMKLIIGTKAYQLVGLHQGRMILYSEEFAEFFPVRELAYLERRD